MAGRFLGIADERGQPPVEVLPDGKRRVRVEHRPQQRVREPDLSVDDLDDLRLEARRRAEASRCSCAPANDTRSSRVGAASAATASRVSRSAAGRARAGPARATGASPAPGAPARAEVKPGGAQGARLLEGEERVAARDLVDPPQERARHRVPEVGLDQAAERGEVERPERESLSRSAGALAGSPWAPPSPAPAGDEKADRLRAEAAGGESDAPEATTSRATGRRRRRRSTGRSRASARSAPEERGRDLARVGLLACRGDEEGHLERLPLRAGQLREHVVEHGLEQIAQPGEGELRLDLDRAGRQNDERRGRAPRQAPRARAPSCPSPRAPSICSACEPPRSAAGTDRALRAPIPGRPAPALSSPRPLSLSPPTLTLRLPRRKPRPAGGDAEPRVPTHLRPKNRASAFQRASSAFRAERGREPRPVGR